MTSTGNGTGGLDGARLHQLAAALFDLSAEGILIERDGRIVYANRAMAELVGHHEGVSLIGQNTLALYGEKQVDAVLKLLQAAHFDRPIGSTALHLPRADGSGIDVQVHCFRLHLLDAPILIELVRPCRSTALGPDPISDSTKAGLRAAGWSGAAIDAPGDE